VFNGNNIGADIGGGLRNTSFVIENCTFLNHDNNALNIINDAAATSLAKFQGRITGNTVGNGTPIPDPVTLTALRSTCAPSRCDI
jgi:hypothetical protein